MLSRDIAAGEDGAQAQERDRKRERMSNAAANETIVTNEGASEGLVQARQRNGELGCLSSEKRAARARRGEQLCRASERRGLEGCDERGAQSGSALISREPRRCSTARSLCVVTGFSSAIRD